jgi:hypothetical protein
VWPTGNTDSSPIGHVLDPVAERGAEGASATSDRGAGAPLGNYAKTAATAGQKPDGPDIKRAEKFDALRKLAKITSLPRVSKCKRVSRIEGGEVHARHGAKASIAGLVTCGSIWACPVCSAVISAKRAQELDKLIGWNVEREGSLALLTLTMRHHRGHGLRELRDALTGAWRHVTKSRSWAEAKKRHSMDGYVRAIEVTYGENGWHLHIHCLLIFRRPITDFTAADLQGRIYYVWSTGLVREGFEASEDYGVDVRRGDEALETLGRYINKITYEVVGGRWKKESKGGRPPFQLLAEGLATGNADDIERWLTWEKGSKGMRQLVWSRGLKDRVGVNEETDEEIAEREQPGETFAVLPRLTWLKVHPVVEHFLDEVEAAGPNAGLAWLAQRGLEYRPVGGFVGEDVTDTPADIARNGIMFAGGTAARNDQVAGLTERLAAKYGPSAVRRPARPATDDQDEPVIKWRMADDGRIDVAPRGTTAADVAVLVERQAALREGREWIGPDPLDRDAPYAAGVVVLDGPPAPAVPIVDRQTSDQRYAHAYRRDCGSSSCSPCTQRFRSLPF